MKRILSFVVLPASAVAALVASAAAQENRDPDRFKTATALFYEGQKAEEKRPPNPELALSKYKKAVEKAKAEQNKEIGARACWRIAQVNEGLEPENLADAKAAYEQIAADFGGVAPWEEKARERVTYDGVDVWLRQLHRQLDAWRVSSDRSSVALGEKKQPYAEKIIAKDKAAIPGLLWGLGHPDEVIRDFSAHCLAEVIDNEGVGALVGKLNAEDPHARSGAAAALRRVYRKYNDAAEFDTHANALQKQLESVAVASDSRAAGHHEKLKAEIAKLREQAGKIRHNLPETLATPEIQGALEKIIGDETASAQARREAATAAAWIGRISGPLVDALVKGMESADRNVREACSRSAGAVDTTLSADKHKLADVLIKNVQYEPHKDENKGAAVWANDDAVRQACAEALERIGLVKSLPALIEALDDNSTLVRRAAFEALSRITHKDLEVSKDETTQLPKGYEPDAPLAERRAGQAKWQEWWTNTQGVVVLVERFYRFQSQWRDLDVLKLFEPANFLKEIQSRAWIATDPKIVEDRANAVLKDFQARKDVYVQDAVDLGGEAIDKLLGFIGGETELNPKPSAATRYFVAEAVAKLIEKNNLSDAVGKVRDLVGAGDSPAKKAGAATCLGFLPKGLIGASEKAALQDQGLAAGEAEVRVASATSLGKVGDDGSAAALTRAAADADASVQVAALRSLAILKPKNADAVKALGEMVADEPEQIGASGKKSPNPVVREYAVDALGEIADPAATGALLRARRDSQRNVFEAARAALPKVYQTDKAAVSEELKKTFTD
ncbi:MAG TPA: HEAT repeat domain-containing protein, partial [Planctomycetota bacterium]|nr:HEAT repeat domain-containing protein [Planctomycetota bacterium]